MAKPRIINQATWPPNWSWAIPTMASLVGTTPWVPAAPWIITPRGCSDDTTKVAPALMSRKPNVAFSAPPITWPVDLRSAINPTAVMIPMR